MKIIAEAACAHGGDFGAALRMVDVAVEAGCQAVKFQMFQAELIPQVKDDLIPFLKRCEWGQSKWEQLYHYCENRIQLIVTPFDMPSVRRLNYLGLDTVKIPSGRLTDKAFVDYIRQWPWRIIASTGMLDYNEVRQLRRFYNDITLLHCTSAYPCPLAEVNLNVLRNRMFAGLSDHTRSLLVPAAAVAMGAEIIEKHFTLNRFLPGPDQKVSLEPDELREMMRNIREVQTALGDGQKKIMPAEADTLHRKVIVERDNGEQIADRVEQPETVGRSNEIDGAGTPTD